MSENNSTKNVSREEAELLDENDRDSRYSLNWNALKAVFTTMYPDEDDKAGLSKGSCAQDTKGRKNNFKSRPGLPEPRGPFGVSFIDVDFVMPLTQAAPTVKKEWGLPVLCRLFYPTQDSTAGLKECYASWLPSPAYYEAYGNLVKAPWWMSQCISRLTVGSGKIPAVHGLKPLTKLDQNKHFVVFSHGMGAMRTTNSSICTQFASFGYIVLSVEHRDGSACLTYGPPHADDQHKHAMIPLEPIPYVHLSSDETDEMNAGEQLFSPIHSPISGSSHTHPEEIFRNMTPVSLPTSTNDEQPSNKVSERQKERQKHRFFTKTGWRRKAKDKMTARLIGHHSFRTHQLCVRRREVQTCIDWIRNPQRARILFASHANSASILDELFKNKTGDNDNCTVDVTGHSFGACTAMYVAGMDERVRKCIAYDPWMFPLPNGPCSTWFWRKKALSCLIILSASFQWRENVATIREYLHQAPCQQAESFLYTLKDSAHQDFADFICLVRRWMFELCRVPTSSHHPHHVLLTSVARSLEFLGDTALNWEQNQPKVKATRQTIKPACICFKASELTKEAPECDDDLDEIWMRAQKAKDLLPEPLVVDPLQENSGAWAERSGAFAENIGF